MYGHFVHKMTRFWIWNRVIMCTKWLIHVMTRFENSEIASLCVQSDVCHFVHELVRFQFWNRVITCTKWLFPARNHAHNDTHDSEFYIIWQMSWWEISFKESHINSTSAQLKEKKTNLLYFLQGNVPLWHLQNVYLCLEEKSSFYEVNDSVHSLAYIPTYIPYFHFLKKLNALYFLTCCIFDLSKNDRNLGRKVIQN